VIYLSMATNPSESDRHLRGALQKNSDPKIFSKEFHELFLHTLGNRKTILVLEINSKLLNNLLENLRVFKSSPKDGDVRFMGAFRAIHLSMASEIERHWRGVLKIFFSNFP
jgi:hypothetical protein